jgi:tRNA U55 pseudouridine synthase TruB
VRSIAQALGGHCTTLRRTAVGPFAVIESAPVDDATLLPVADALERLPADALDRVPEAVRAGVLALDAPVGNGRAA